MTSDNIAQAFEDVFTMKWDGESYPEILETAQELYDKVCDGCKTILIELPENDSKQPTMAICNHLFLKYGYDVLLLAGGPWKPTDNVDTRHYLAGTLKQLPKGEVQ